MRYEISQLPLPPVFAENRVPGAWRWPGSGLPTVGSRITLLPEAQPTALPATAGPPKRWDSKAIIIAVCVVVGAIGGYGLHDLISRLRAADAEQASIQKQISDAIAAVKVCTKGSTYAEFRMRQLALETCYEANKRYLTTIGDDFARLSTLMRACDHCWSRAQQGELAMMFPGTNGVGRLEDLNAMEILNPSIRNKLNLDLDNQLKDPDFYPSTYVRRALGLIDEQCDSVLVGLRERRTR